MRNRKNGITLIALVITVIVLLILAGVSISLVVGDNGVLIQASNAVIENRKASAREDVEMAFASAEADYWSDWAKGTSTEKNPTYYEDKIPGYLNNTGTFISLSYEEQNGNYEYEVKYQKNGIEYTFIVDTNGHVRVDGEGTAVSLGENENTTGGENQNTTGESSSESGIGENSSITTYTVTFHINKGDTTTYATKTVNSGESIGSSNMPANPTKDNYTFSGWKKESDDSEFTASKTISEVTKVYADWTLNGTAASANSSYVGYYIKKGNEYAIIYIDLLGKTTYTGGALQSSSSVSVPSSVTSGKTFKTYVVTDTKYTDPNGHFGTNNVIEVLNSTGEDRFIAMALSDYDTNKHTWWYWFNSNNGSYSLVTSKEIGSGKTNTENVKTVWDNAGSSKQNTKSGYTDVWSLITLNSGSADWFIPSNNEWIAFGAMNWTDHADTPVSRNITSSNYYGSTFELNLKYWSSTRYLANAANVTIFNSDKMGYETMDKQLNIRLSTTF